MVLAVLGIVTPVFLIAALGYLWVRFKQPFDTNTIGQVVMYLGSPCLIYASLMSNAPELQSLTIVAGAAVFIIMLNVAAAFIFLRVMGWPVATFLPALSQPNGGNMGLPVVLLAFGETGLALGMAYFFVNSVSQYTLGLGVSSGHFDIRQLIKQPVIWAVVLVFTLLLTNSQMPKWFNDTTQILAGLTIPAMLLMLGTSLATLNISAISQTLTVAILRFAFGLGLGLLAIWIFDLDGMIAGIVLLQATMPAAVFNYVFAERFNRDPDKVAAVILQSTLLSVVTLPILVAWAISM